MIPLSIGAGASPRILCLGAHSDDIEIGAAATIRRLAHDYPGGSIAWVVFAAGGDRGREARASAEFCTRGFASADIRMHEFRDGFFPAESVGIKEAFQRLGQELDPDVVFTHNRDDLHQDHRVIAEITWQTFRDHLVLEYEIPKYDGDLGRPNCYVPMTDALREEKQEILERFFASQRSKSWFSRETFDALMRLRGIESRAPSGYAEAFYARKIIVGPLPEGESRG